MKKYYNMPVANILALTSADVITTSGMGDGKDDVMNINGEIVPTGSQLSF